MTWHRPRTAVTLIVLALLAFGGAPAFADSGTFSTDADLTMSGMGSQAGPTTVSVSGLGGSIADITVTLSGVTMSGDTTDILLVSPSGASVKLFGDILVETDGFTWRYNDAGQAQVDGSASPPDYHPGNASISGDNDTFMAPAPTSGYGTDLGSLGGSPNGDWKLFMRNDFDASPQVISGWSLDIVTNPDVAPGSKDFGALAAGSTSAPQTFTVTNTSSSALGITATRLEGAHAGDFAITLDHCQGSVLEGGATCPIAVAFKPTSGGDKAAALIIENDQGTPPTEIPLTGTGLLPGIAISPSAVDFGDVPFGSSPRQLITVSNPGAANLSLTLPASPSSDFTISIQDLGATPACGGELAPGASCGFAVIFTPLTAGAKSAAISMSDNAPGGPHGINLTGNALPPQVIVPPGPPGPVESGSDKISIQNVSFSSPPAVGQPTTLDVTATNNEATVTGLLVDFGEALGLYAASACVEGSNEGGTQTFSVPYVFLTPGQHKISITVFSGGCAKPDAHTYVLTVDVGAPTAARRIAARRIANTAATLAGPNITSKCKNAKLAPTTKNGKKVVTALVCVINEQRKLVKLKPYKLSKKLTKSALNHTRAMVGGKFFAHQGPREPALSSRLKKVKYRYAGGENIGAGAGQLGSPLMMVNGWMHSSLHKANLLSKRFKVIGVGFIARYPLPTSAKPVATYTANFGAK